MGRKVDNARTSLERRLQSPDRTHRRAATTENNVTGRAWGTGGRKEVQGLQMTFPVN